MALLLAEAQKLSNNELELGVVEEVVDKDDLFALLPFVKIGSKAYVYNRETVPSEGAFLAPSGTVAEAATTFNQVTATLRILIGDVDVDKFMDETMSDANSQKAVQIAQKAKGLGRKFRRTLAIGDASVNALEFDGLAALATNITAGVSGECPADASRTISAATNGTSITFAMLDKLLDAVPNGADCIFMHEAVIRAYRTLLRTTGGGTSAAEIMLPAFGRPMLCHNGIPILHDNFISITEDQGTTTAGTTSVYAVRLNEADGLHGIYGGGSAGIVVEEIGTVQTKDSSRTRLKWYVGLVLKSTMSLARLKGLTNIS